MRKYLSIFIILMVFALALSACGQAATQEPSSGETGTTGETGESEEPTAEPAESGEPKIATMIFTQEPDTLNPLYTNMFFSGITQQFWNVWTWQYDDQNEPYPVLVTELPSVENGGISEDGKTLTLKLRDDLLWSDGEKVTSADYKFTYEMTMDPNNTVSSVYPYDQLASFETPDDTTVVVTFEEPFAPWLGLFHGLLPEHVLRPVFDAEGTIDNADWNSAPTVGIGPFVFAEWESGSFLRFVRNENYFGEKALLDEIFIRIVPDDASQVAALKTGDGDIGIFLAYPDLPALEEAGLAIVSVKSGYNEGWYMSLHPDSHPALKDVKVRQALAYAIDRAQISRDLLQGKTEPGATYWDDTPYADPSLTPYPFDPEKAKTLLDEAGWKDSNEDGTRDKDGEELVLVYGTTTREVRQSTQAVFQQMLADVGVKVELFNVDGDIFFETYGNNGPTYTGELDIMEWSDTTAYPDPDIAYWLCSEIPSDDYPVGVNAQFICDEELDALFQLQATQVDMDERIATFQKISKMMYDQVYWLSIWKDPDIWAVGARLMNVKLSGATPFYNVSEWDSK